MAAAMTLTSTSDGRLSVGVTADRAACPDVDSLITGIERYADALIGSRNVRHRRPQGVS